MSQSRKMSLKESLANITVGYVLAVISQMIIYPIFNIHIPLQDYFLIGIWFNLISFCRNYGVRRWFNGKEDS